MGENALSEHGDSELLHRAMAVLLALDETLKRDDYAGWDPFDGLNSRLLSFTPLAYLGFGRLAWLQLCKRSPVNLRPLAMVPKVQNAKALALLARANLLRGQQEEALKLVERMLSLRSNPELWGGGAWGYPFDWQARAFYVPSGVPNVICTTYAVLALQAAQEAGIGEYGAIIRESGRFVAENLVCRSTQAVQKGARYLGYIPASPAMVHNASLWGCYILLSAHAAGGDAGWKALAQEAIQYTLNAQREDGAWIYGEASHHQFVDGFHTGYNLEALHRMRQLAPEWDAAITPAIEKGLDYYTQYLFEEDGLPRYYDTNRWPVDCHSTSQAVLTLLQVSPTVERRALAAKVLDWTLQHLWLPERGHFAYQQTRHFTCRIPYLRWTQSWMYLALATWLAEGRGR